MLYRFLKENEKPKLASISNLPAHGWSFSSFLFDAQCCFPPPARHGSQVFHYPRRVIPCRRRHTLRKIIVVDKSSKRRDCTRSCQIIYFKWRERELTLFSRWKLEDDTLNQAFIFWSSKDFFVLGSRLKTRMEITLSNKKSFLCTRSFPIFRIDRFPMFIQANGSLVRSLLCYKPTDVDE